MPDKLEVYNLTLGHLRERRLASLTDPGEPRRVLDDAWDQIAGECLEEALWNFMVRAISTDASTTLTPGFGWTYAFPIPDDWVRTVMLSGVDSFSEPLLDYMEEAGVWYANVTPLYVRYVSNDTDYGMDLSRWTRNFTKFVSLALAEQTCGRITGSDTLLESENGITRRLKKARTKAKSNDAMNQPPGQMPAGTWSRSRRGFLRGVPAPGGTGAASFDD